jgi:hypothetical protein
LNDKDRAARMSIAIAGMVSGTLIESLNDAVKDLRRYAGNDFKKCLEVLES